MRIMNSSNLGNEPAEEIIAVLRESLRTLRFGSVEFVIHDGRVVQIDRKEKLRVHPATADLRSHGSHGK
ncbi:MAG: YezD family protein [Gammaproteobacteria bacterium]|nr:YezD family protein [Gammaproteobacteria bacterium]